METSASWKPQVLSRAVMGLLFLLKLYAENAPETKLVYQSARRYISEDCIFGSTALKIADLTVVDIFLYLVSFPFSALCFSFVLLSFLFVLCLSFLPFSLSTVCLPCPLPFISLVPYSSSLSQCRTCDLLEV